MKPPAEFESYRRRVEQDRAAAGRQAKRQLLLGLLEMADAFDRTLDYADASPESAEAGLRAMLQKAEQRLAKQQQETRKWRERYEAAAAELDRLREGVHRG